LPEEQEEEQHPERDEQLPEHDAAPARLFDVLEERQHDRRVPEGVHHEKEERRRGPDAVDPFHEASLRPPRGGYCCPSDADPATPPPAGPVPMPSGRAAATPHRYGCRRLPSRGNARANRTLGMPASSAVSRSAPSANPPW